MISSMLQHRNVEKTYKKNAKKQTIKSIHAQEQNNICKNSNKKKTTNIFIHSIKIPCLQLFCEKRKILSFL